MPLRAWPTNRDCRLEWYLGNAPSGHDLTKTAPIATKRRICSMILRISELHTDGISTLGWIFDRNPINISLDGVNFIQADQERCLIFVLKNKDNENIPCKLNIFNEEGDIVAELNPPEGFKFYYLIPYPKLGVSVVCSTDNPINGWPDWHFGYDDQKRELYRHAPSY